MTKLQTALEFLRLGIAVIPLRHRGKEPETAMLPIVIDPETGQQNKSWEPFRKQIPTEYAVKRWLSSDWQNYGVLTGWNNLTVIDFDNMGVFAVWTQYMKPLFKYDVIAMPYMVKTNRGVHVYVTHPCNERVTTKRTGIDVKETGYVVGAGSTHPSGAEYTAMTAMHFPEVYDLDTLLPPDLFPHVESAPAIEMPILPEIKPAPLDTEYDAFASASNASQNATGHAQGLDLITKVKSLVRIENYFPNARFTSSDHRWMIDRCPFHDDQTPSMWIDARRQICGCNTCGFKPLDVINLFAKQHNITEAIAVVELAKVAGVWR